MLLRIGNRAHAYKQCTHNAQNDTSMFYRWLCHSGKAISARSSTHAEGAGNAHIIFGCGRYRSVDECRCQAFSSNTLQAHNCVIRDREADDMQPDKQRTAH
jgi:tRNA G37 N-methylase TrmD